MFRFGVSLAYSTAGAGPAVAEAAALPDQTFRPADLTVSLVQAIAALLVVDLLVQTVEGDGFD